MDTTRLNRLVSLISEFEDNKDSISFYNVYICTLLIEQDILNALSEKVVPGLQWNNQYATVYKEKDIVMAGDKYSFIIVPDVEYDHNLVDVSLDSGLVILCDDKRENIPTEIENIAGLIAIKIRPEKPGLYKIQGNLILKSRSIDISFRSKFIDRFYVKETIK